MRIPLPETRRAYLPADGATRATFHTYDGYREIEQRRPEPGERHAVRQFEYLFRCSETGKLRRWGVAAVVPPQLAVVPS